MPFETLSAWLQWLEQQHPKSIDLGLERVAEVATRLQLASLLQHNKTVITVAGTNGKGSFIASLQALLLAKGKKVATYTSPHMLLFNERMLLNGDMCSDDAIMEAFTEIYAALESVSLSYFEFTTLAALWLFAHSDVEYCLLEVGLGGRLDAVNIIAPDWAVITSIGIDHCDYLGDTLDSIATEKCGILRQDTPLICAEATPPQVLKQACDIRRSWMIGKDFAVDSQKLDNSATIASWCFKDLVNDQSSAPLPDTGLSLPSQAAAIQLYRLLLGADYNVHDLEALNNITLPGRFQRYSEDDLDIVMDVAHNPQAVALLKQRLNEQMPLAQGQKRIAVFAMLADKDIEATVALLKDDFTAWFLADLKHPRAIAASDMAAKVHQQGIHMISVSKNIRQAYARAKSLCVAGDQIVVFGSFFTVAEILKKFKRVEHDGG